MRRTRGFTLMELVVAMALGLILLYVVYVSLDSASRATNQTLSQVNLHTRGRAIMELLQRDLETMVADLGVASSSDELIFVCAAREVHTVSGNAASELQEVSYRRVDPAGETPRLKRVVRPLHANLSLGTPKTQVLDLNCTSFEPDATKLSSVSVRFTVMDKAAGISREFAIRAQTPLPRP
jgi:prepilin-type N-terminal cleavage/methylation domain-containing protein